MFVTFGKIAISSNVRVLFLKVPTLSLFDFYVYVWIIRLYQLTTRMLDSSL